jgi:tetratricopeptide (TPR) repeat protein
MPKRRFLLALLGALAVVPAWADTVILKDGTILHGKVVELPDGRVEIETKRGNSRIVEKVEIKEWLDRDGANGGARQLDLLYLVDGRVLVGNVNWSDDGKELVLTNDKGAESRFPRELVKAIQPRKGKVFEFKRPEDTAPITTEEETEKKWTAQIEANLKKLTDWSVDEKEKTKARKEIVELGVFALNYVKAEIAKVGSNDTAVRPVLEKVLKVAEFKQVVPAKIEEAIPGVCERLVEERLEERVKTLGEIATNCPEDCAPLFLHLIRTDGDPKIKSICVGHLSILKRYDELAQVLKMHEHGQWRLVAALELGEAGIYVGIPVLIEALKLDGPKFQDVRILAIEKLKSWTKQGNLGYLPESDDRSERETAVARWEAWWQSEGQIWAEKNAKIDMGQVSDDDKKKALDAWRDGNKVLVDLQKRQDEAARTGTKLEPAAVSYEYERAAFLFKQAYDADPTLCTARLSRAIILYEQLGRPREAEGELKLVLNRFAPENAKYLRSLATTHLAKIAELEANWKRAEICWVEVHVLDPENLDAPVGIGDSHLERALFVDASSIEPVTSVTEGRPNVTDEKREGLKAEKRDEIQAAVIAYKDALKLVDKKERSLTETVSELSPTGEVEDHQTGRYLMRVREDRETLERRAAEIWFRLGRAESARGQVQEAFHAFKSAHNIDSKNDRYTKAFELWEKLAGGEKP